MKYIYLAGPYSHENPRVMAIRETLLTVTAAYYIERGYNVFSPITESSEYQRRGGLKGCWDFWGERDKQIISKVDEVWVLNLPGWEKSIGVSAEIEFANSIEIPVYHIKYTQLVFEILDGAFC